MQGLKGKLRKLHERVLTETTVYHADLTEQDLGRMQELINRGLVNQHGTNEGRAYRRARGTTRPDLNGGVS